MKKIIIIIGIIIVIIMIILVNNNSQNENFTVPKIPKNVVNMVRSSASNLGLLKNKPVPETKHDHIVKKEEKHHIEEEKHKLHHAEEERHKMHHKQEEINYQTEEENNQIKQINATGEIIYADIDDKNQNAGHVAYPDYDKIIDYDDFICIKKSNNRKVNPKQLVEFFCDAGVPVEKDIGDSRIENDIGTGRMIESKITANCYNDDNFENPVKYRNFQTFVKSHLEDPVLRGGNIGDYSEVSPIFQSGNISLIKDTKYPEPEGFVFNTSSVANR